MNKLSFLFGRYNNKVLCKYQIFEGKKAQGIMHFKNVRKEFISGPYGKGYAPQGKYKVKKITLLDKTFEHFASYAQFGFGWFMPIIPQFETDRSGLGFHADGNIEGSQGCVVFNFYDIDENVRMYNLFRDYLEVHNSLDVEIA